MRVGGAPVFQDQRVFQGSAVVTGPSSRVVLRFDDGGQVILDQNTEFRIADFRYSAGSDRTIFDLVKGALRVVSGTIGRRSPGSFQPLAESCCRINHPPTSATAASASDPSFFIGPSLGKKDWRRA